MDLIKKIKIPGILFGKPGILSFFINISVFCLLLPVQRRYAWISPCFFRIENKVSEESKSSAHTYIDHRMLFQEHGGHDDQYGKDKRTISNAAVFSEGFTVCQGHMNGKGIKHMNTGKNIRWSICNIKHSDSICKNIVPWKFGRTKMLNIGIQIRYNKEDCHSHHQVKYKLIVFMLVLVEKDKVNYCKYHIRKP